MKCVPGHSYSAFKFKLTNRILQKMMNNYIVKLLQSISKTFAAQRVIVSILRKTHTDLENT